MGRVLTNSVTLKYCKETSLGVPGVEWFNLEPDTITSFGAEIVKTSRSSISKNRQAQKDIISDLNSSVGTTSDLTGSSFRDFIAGFCFAKSINSEITQIKSTLATSVANSYTVDALSDIQVSKLKAGTLLWVTGGMLPENLGLKSIAIDTIVGDTSIVVVENLVDEPSKFRLSMAGTSEPSLSVLSWSWNDADKRATLGGAGIGTRLQSLGVRAGIFVHFGSISSQYDKTINNVFKDANGTKIYGYARCLDIGDDYAVFSKTDKTLQYDSVPQTGLIDIIFGEFVRNVQKDDVDFLEQSFQFEMTFPNLGENGADEYQYALGNYCSTIAINLPLTEKVTTNYEFLGTDTENPVGDAGRKPGAVDALDPTMKAAFGTSSDLARLRIADVDESGLSTDFKNINLTINNNISPEKVLGKLGARFINYGDYSVEIDGQMLFSNSLIINRIRENKTVSLDFILNNQEGVIVVDIPSVTIGGGGREFTKNESVTIGSTLKAHEDAILKTSIGISIIPVPFEKGYV